MEVQKNNGLIPSYVLPNHLWINECWDHMLSLQLFLWISIEREEVTVEAAHNILELSEGSECSHTVTLSLMCSAFYQLFLPAVPKQSPIIIPIS